MRRTLSLKRDVLAELSPADLESVGAAAAQTQISCLNYITCGGIFYCYLKSEICPTQ
jgi:hypothetical protein